MLCMIISWPVVGVRFQRNIAILETRLLLRRTWPAPSSSSGGACSASVPSWAGSVLDAEAGSGVGQWSAIGSGVGWGAGATAARWCLAASRMASGLNQPPASSCREMLCGVVAAGPSNGFVNSRTSSANGGTSPCEVTVLVALVALSDCAGRRERSLEYELEFCE